MSMAWAVCIALMVGFVLGSYTCYLMLSKWTRKVEQDLKQKLEGG